MVPCLEMEECLALFSIKFKWLDDAGFDIE